MKTKLEQFRDVIDTPKSSYELHEIVPAAFDGKIDTLFVEEDSDVYGQYDLENRNLKTALNKAVSNVSLVNMAATTAFMKGGKVYFLDKTEMPVKNRPLNALMRF
jgi:translation initiation factor RLI1